MRFLHSTLHPLLIKSTTANFGRCFLDPIPRIWTRFLLAGLKGEQDLFTYRLRRNESGSETGEILDSDSVKIVHPFFNSPRLLAQDGAFTIHSNPWKSLESYASDGTEFAHPDLDIDALYSWLVPTGNKVRLIKELSGLGITHRLLFPDLDGVAKSLWETEVLWSREDS